jgi:hypothetical protein
MFDLPITPAAVLPVSTDANVSMDQVPNPPQPPKLAFLLGSLDPNISPAGTPSPPPPPK